MQRRAAGFLHRNEVPAVSMNSRGLAGLQAPHA